MKTAIGLYDMTLPQKVLPAFLSQPEWAFKQNNRLILIPAELKKEYEKKYTLVPVSRIIFGLRIPFLPDLIASPNLSGSNDREKLYEVWLRQVNLITTLGKWKNGGFSLRYLWNPSSQNIEIAFLASGLSLVAEEGIAGSKLFEDISQIIKGQDYPIEPISDADRLKHYLDPIPGGYIVEIRQKEKLLQMIRGSAYVVYTFGVNPYSTWLNLFNLICNQSSACVVNLHLEPTILSEGENQFMAGAAQLAATLSHENFQGLSGRYEFSDPIAQTVSNIYKDYLGRFQDPFLVVSQVISSDPYLARNVAQGIVAEVSVAEGNGEPRYDDRQLPNGADLALPVKSSELDAAKRTLTSLDLTPWGDTEAHSGQERLIYMADAKTASAIFRFPVAIRGGIPGLSSKQVVPSQEVSFKIPPTKNDDIVLGHFLNRGGVVSIPISFLNRHMLVAGTNGSGKTTTCFTLLTQLWSKGIPFLVIEPQKTEYRSLIETQLKDSIQLFTLGDEGLSPFRLNPLEIFPGVRVETHISYIRACFEAALPTFGVLPSLIEESLHNVYHSKGWSLTDRGKKDDTRLMPTLGEMYREIIRVTDERGYSDKTAQDIRAAASGRIGSLLRGSKGRMLNTRLSFPIEQLMKMPTVLELESLNDDEKALVMLFLMTSLQEYCRVHRTKSELQHITLIEEAHRIMSATSHVGNREVQADTSAAAVSMVSSALSEVRGYGEGFIIAEQIPTRLAEDALKNTNIKIIHRLPGKDDREQVGATMNMEKEQENFLIKLGPGQAAIYMEGYERPTFIAVDDFRQANQLHEKTKEDLVQDHMKPFQAQFTNRLYPFIACKFCLKQCNYRDRLSPIVYDMKTGERFDKAYLSFETVLKQGDDIKAWSNLAEASKSALVKSRLGKDAHAAYCYLAHLWPTEFTQEMSLRFRQAFLGA